MIRDQLALLEQIRAIHAAIRAAVITACERATLEELSAVVGEDAGDTIFALDRISEAELLEHFATLAEEWPHVLIAEGLGSTGMVILPEGCPPEKAELCIIVDPIDGTRSLMYQKRSAWILTGVAPNRGPDTSLSDIVLAVQTELPLVKQHLSDSFWALAGQGAQGERWNRLTGESRPLQPHPSRARTIAQGFGGLARFFPGARGELATIDDLVYERVLGPVQIGRAQAFEDQYICSGGQLAELMLGHDRWIADLRPLIEPYLRQSNRALGICCHPYDLCTELIAREAGVLVTDARGRHLSAPLDVSSEVDWMGFANEAVRDQVAPVLREILSERGLF